MGTGGCFYAPELLSSLSQESRALPQTFCPRRACGSGRKGGRRRPACAVPARPPSGRLPPLSGCPPGPVPADFYVAKAQKARLLLVASNKRATRKWLAITRQHNSPATRQRAAGEFSQQLELAGWPGDPFRVVLARTGGEVGCGPQCSTQQHPLEEPSSEMPPTSQNQCCLAFALCFPSPTPLN